MDPGVGTMQVCLLRGVNVGGHRRVPMAELRDVLAELGFVGVRTYIQSGNIVFDGGPPEPGEAIRQCIVDRFGVDVPAIIRSGVQLASALQASEGHFPFEDVAEPMPHDKRVHVVFLSAVPGPAARLAPELSAGEELVLDGQELHVRYREGAGKSRLSVDMIERTLGVGATGRNLTTVRALAALAA